MRHEVFKSVIWALIVTMLLGVAIVVGSRNLSRFDSALVALMEGYRLAVTKS